MTGTVRGSTLIETALWPGTIVTICMSCFMTGDPDKEYRTNKATTNRKSSGKVERRHCLSVHFPESLLPASILTERCVRHQERVWIRMIGQSHPETNHHKTQDCEPRGRAALLGSLTYCSPPGCPFPVKSLALSACVSSDNSFPSVRQEPSFGPWKRSPFLQQYQLGFRKLQIPQLDLQINF